MVMLGDGKSENIVSKKQIGSWSSLELISKDGQCILKFKHWSQYVRTLIGILLICLAGSAVVAVVYNFALGLAFAGASIFGVLLVVVASVERLDGTDLTRFDGQTGVLHLPGEHFEGKGLAVYEVYLDGRNFQASYILVVTDKLKSVAFQINETKPNESLVEEFCKKNGIPYRCQCVVNRKDLVHECKCIMERG